MTESDVEILAKLSKSQRRSLHRRQYEVNKGVAPIRSLLDHGVTVGLGTDGPSSGNTLDLFTQMRMVANFHKTHLKDRSAFPPKEIVALATRGGAKALGLDEGSWHA